LNKRLQALYGRPMPSDSASALALPSREAAEALRRLVPVILERFLWQNSLPVPPKAELVEVGLRLWDVVAEHGLAPALPPGEPGAPGELPEAECAALVARTLAGSTPALREELALPVRHLVKASFNPEFRECRNSYREPSPDGFCRRQDLARARKRTSGTHCVDCPYWTSLRPGEHLQLLIKAWKPEALPLLAGCLDIFLPEDFRAFRGLIQALRPTAKGAAVLPRTSSSVTPG